MNKEIVWNELRGTLWQYIGKEHMIICDAKIWTIEELLGEEKNE